MTENSWQDVKHDDTGFEPPYDPDAFLAPDRDEPEAELEEPDTCLNNVDGHWYVVTYGQAPYQFHAKDCVTCILRMNCTCCTPPRPCTAPRKGEEFAHDDDETFAETFHVHESTTSQDCDGRYDRDSVTTIAQIIAPGVDDASDLWNYMVRHSIAGHEQVTLTLDGEAKTCEVSERTDEGYRHTYLRGCRDDCAEEEPTFRDYTAEAAGY